VLLAGLELETNGFQAISPDDLRMRAMIGGGESFWIRPQESRPNADLLLLAFPYAGGGPEAFAGWSTCLPTGIELNLVQLPGRGSRLGEKAFNDLPRLLDALVPAIARKLNKPFAVFGHSMGAIIAFEVVRRLRKQYGRLPAHLFVSGKAAPHLPCSDIRTYLLPDDELIERLGELNGTPDACLAHSELMELLLPTIRADFELCETYKFQSEAPLECPITAYAGAEDAECSADDISEWRKHTSSDFELQVFPGAHFFVRSSIVELNRSIAQRALRGVTRYEP
jgi:medium-chain acyl-[acyl-carrier-protein] hydrolase